MTNSEENFKKLIALANHLELSDDELNDIQFGEADCIYTYGQQEYLVLDNQEADELTEEYIKRDLWAFKAEFLASHIPCLSAEDIQKIQESLNEDCNEMLRKLIGDEIGNVVWDAIISDGRGAFLALYDHQEHEVVLKDGVYFIYRTN